MAYKSKIEIIDTKETGKLIKTVIQTSGISVDYISKCIGVSKGAIYKWFQGVTMPTVDNFVVLASVVGIKVDDLIVKKEISIG